MDPEGMSSTEQLVTDEEQSDSYGDESWGLVEPASVLIKIEPESEEGELCMEPGSIHSSERLGEVHQGKVHVKERLEAASCADVKGGQVTAEPNPIQETSNQIQSSPSCPEWQKNTSTPISKGQHYQCHICSAQFAGVVQLTLHAKTHRRSKDEGSKIRKCRSCCKVLHHTPKEVQKMDLCEKCRVSEMSCSGQDALDAVKEDDPIAVTADESYLHVAAKPEEKRTEISSIGCVKRLTLTFTCQLCGQIFVSADALERHRLKSHKAKETFRCKVCKKKCSDQTTLDLHVKTKHTVARPFICHNCGKSYYQKAHLEDHVAVHYEDKRFQCSLCHKKFQIRRSLQRHSKTCIGHPQDGEMDSICSDMMACQYCSEKFLDRTVLTKHVKECHMDKLPFCELCNKHFTERSSLVVHYRVHTGYKPHKCDYCEKSFSRRHHLKLHVRLHTGENPFPCDKCSRSFKRKEHLKSHFQKIHASNKKGYKVYTDAECKYVCKVEGCNKRYHHRSQLWRHRKVHEQQGIS